MSNTAIRILYVEDDATLASVTTRALTRRGFDVVHYESISAARSGSQLQEFTWALLDLKLEDGSSLELIGLLLDKNPDIKIVVLTAYASIATAVQTIKLGATNYLSKPATIDQILQAFENDAPTCADEADTAHVVPLRRIEWEHIQKALADNAGNISATARQLKMHRRTLQRKLAKKPVGE
ncbi:response regulator [Saccharophagus sp. K07]|jgi:two-component system response regulator RegA|uniref:response regulator transcription factor n=1 Tax=Saccharophagus sp. K07 TaxID=2283636 RepID=UPI001651DC68|nr:response regulator [Saccharophagus sp. K07]MBC6906985.1 response regulator [Saccharophagus sp. K07]